MYEKTTKENKRAAKFTTFISNFRVFFLNVKFFCLAESFVIGESMPSNIKLKGLLDFFKARSEKL